MAHTTNVYMSAAAAAAAAAAYLAIMLLNFLAYWRG